MDDLLQKIQTLACPLFVNRRHSFFHLNHFSFDSISICLLRLKLISFSISSRLPLRIDPNFIVFRASYPILGLGLRKFLIREFNRRSEKFLSSVSDSGLGLFVFGSNSLQFCRFFRVFLGFLNFDSFPFYCF